MKQTTEYQKKTSWTLNATITRMKTFGWDDETISKITNQPIKNIQLLTVVIENKQNKQKSFVKRDFDVTEEELESFPNYRFEEVQNERFL
jgi:hypothetical protein